MRCPESKLGEFLGPLPKGDQHVHLTGDLAMLAIAGTANRWWLGSVLPTTPGMLGYMFWAAERPSTRGVGTVPPNTCEGGVGAGATAVNVQTPMPALRQQ